MFPRSAESRQTLLSWDTIVPTEGWIHCEPVTSSEGGK